MVCSIENWMNVFKELNVLELSIKEDYLKREHFFNSIESTGIKNSIVLTFQKKKKPIQWKSFSPF